MKPFQNFNKDKFFHVGFIVTFTILYAITAFVSFYHAITFFNIANAVWLSVLLSFVAEAGQAAVLFNILIKGNKILPWVIMTILTMLQVIGNVVSSYVWIDAHNGAGVAAFQQSILFWLPATEPQVFKVVIAWISGALLPIIALSMTSLVAQNIDDKEKETIKVNDEPSKTDTPINASDIIGEVSKMRPTEGDLEKLERILNFNFGTNLKPEVKKESPLVPTKEMTQESSEKEEIKSPVLPVFTDDFPVLPHYSDEELNKMSMDEYEKTGSYHDNEEDIDVLDEEVESLTIPYQNEIITIPHPEEIPVPQPEVVISHTNGLIEAVPQDHSEDEKKQPEIERQEKLRAIARENSKKK